MPQLLNEVRADLGLPPLHRAYGEISSFGHPISEGLAMVATFPQLEYPRAWPAHVHVTGPMLFELPGEEVALPEGAQPLVLVAASTTMDAGLELAGTALEALQDEPVRVVATTGGRSWAGAVPGNATVVDWVSHSQVSNEASLVVSVGGHGTVARTLAHGVPQLVCPGGGDMAVNGARVTWAGSGLMLPRSLLRPGPLRWAVRRLLGDRRFAARAREIAAWGRENDGPARGAALVERYALL
jgi:UDP:flavonoid glycosyltransferase YjiC (YdhE family)